jgi:hypothetical protein
LSNLESVELKIAFVAKKYKFDKFNENFTHVSKPKTFNSNV